MRGTLLFLTLTLLYAAPSVGQECSGAATLEATECGGVPFEGCCDGERLLFCEGGMLCAWDCGGKSIPHCGWNATLGYFDCGTPGQEDPAGMFSADCPTGGPDVCGGLDGRGCCDGATVRWCDGRKIHEIDCSGNGARSVCGLREGVADCVEPGGGDGPSCGGGGVTDVVTGGPDGGAIELDSISVPDIAGAPSSCSTIQGIYDVSVSDCGIFSTRFGIKQRGCVAVLVDLIGGDRPVARVTKSGLSFDFLDAGLTRSCLGQIDGDKVVGECTWTGGACAFTFQVTAAPEPEPAAGSGGGGGCGQAAVAPVAGPAFLLFFFLLIALPKTLRRTPTMKHN